MHLRAFVLQNVSPALFLQVPADPAVVLPPPGALAGALVDGAAEEAPLVSHQPQVDLHFCIIIFLYLGALQYFFKLGHCLGVLSRHSPAGAGAFDTGAAVAPVAAPGAPGQSLHVFAQLLVSFALYRGALQYFAYFPHPGILSLQTGAAAAVAAGVVAAGVVGASVGASVTGA